MTACLDCGSTRAHVVLPHGRLCRGCRLRRHYHPRPCPACDQTRPLAYRTQTADDTGDGRDADAEGGGDVCAACAGAVSVFACTGCGSEEHPYGYTRCARCYVEELVTSLLTDPATGGLHPRLVPLHQALTTGRRPQTTYWWLTRPGQVAQDVLSGFASGRLAISHDTFRQLPMDRRHCYLRDLLVSTSILPPWAPAIERIEPWLATILNGQPPAHGEVLSRFARWHVLRRLRQHERAGTLTSSVVNLGRSNINAAVRLLDWVHARETTISALTQAELEEYLVVHPGARFSAMGFLIWLDTSNTNTSLSVVHRPQQLPEVTMSDDARWHGVERLLHDTSIASQSRVAGLFLLLFAQPLNKILQMTHDQIHHHPDRRTTVTFDKVPLELPPVVATVVLDHMRGHGSASYRLGDTQWLFPGRLPGRPITTETVRKVLVDHRIHPRASRSAALFALAGQIPTPVLADLLGITPGNATQWAKLAARDWSNYVATRPAADR